MTVERWKDIPGYSGRYQASSLGRVRSLPRQTGNYKAGRILKLTTAKSGHMKVSLGECHNKQLVHRLVMLAFCGPCPDGQEVLHKDHIPSNNRLANLKYGTYLENLMADYEVGTRIRKTACPAGHPYSGTNLYIAPGGEKGCKTCRRVAVLKFKETNNEKESRAIL